jgi:two-component system, OmpR family, sensor histidine kinase MprB
MTLRLRMAGTAAGAVAVVVAAIAAVVYVAVRADLRGEVDRVLAEQARPLTVEAPGVVRSVAGQAGTGIGVPSGTLAPPRAPPPGKLARRSVVGGFSIAQGPPQPFTGAGGYIQLVRGDGSVTKSSGGGSPPRILPSAAARAIAARGKGRSLADVHVHGEHMRVLTIGLAPGVAAQIARPLTEVDKELSNLVAILLVVGGAGIVAAALVGGVVARTALAPIARFTRRTEGIAESADTTQRLEVARRDELGRLARSFNRTLDELERSVQAQRQLVADASHELRTPISSVRANIQVLEHAGRLPAIERESLRRDVIAELEELTGLVSDLVELARGTKPSAALGDVRLDELAHEAVTRAQRRAEGVAFHVDVEPTLVTGDGERIDRAVANLLDNAMRWSPPGGTVDVTLRDGVLSVRDRGPGFAERDLPHVLARFYRADAARVKPGSGLGLAIVKQAAEAHGGHVEAANAPGGGALVNVTFGPPTNLLRSPDAGLMRA